MGRRVRTADSGAQEGRKKRQIGLSTFPSSIYFLRFCGPRAVGRRAPRKLAAVR